MTYVTLMKGWNQDNSLTLDYAKLCKNTLLLQYPCKFTLALLILYLVFILSLCMSRMKEES